jgi:hypothetical protein
MIGGLDIGGWNYVLLLTLGTYAANFASMSICICLHFCCANLILLASSNPGKGTLAVPRAFSAFYLSNFIVFPFQTLFAETNSKELK